ncbi:toxin glutamine deamidase domain-containing protein [Yersinia aleksiciae]|uniref:toxin glutamine deamidase domain-containing protein n=1 Tax=Yersinia aleksiciae TaxID=263819 RepID=UPI0021BDE7D3|nr:toxin glutamine deamidase domain-containing protein [Yersinia aleksiciae]
MINTMNNINLGSQPEISTCMKELVPPKSFSLTVESANMNIPEQTFESKSALSTWLSKHFLIITKGNFDNEIEKLISEVEPLLASNHDYVGVKLILEEDTLYFYMKDKDEKILISRSMMNKVSNNATLAFDDVNRYSPDMDDDNEFDIISDQVIENTNDNVTSLPKSIENIPDEKFILPDCRINTDGFFNTLLKEVNLEGKPPFILRPLAYLLAKFGIHGFGQTNCASCATAVIDTLNKGRLHLAMPTLRGADVKGIMGLPCNDAKSAAELITKLTEYEPNTALFGVLVIHRPTLWTMFGATRGHACNVIKFKDSDTIHFLDTQKRKYLSYKQEELSARGKEISRFLGSAGVDGIDLYKKNFELPDHKKAEASAPA